MRRGPVWRLLVEDEALFLPSGERLAGRLPVFFNRGSALVIANGESACGATKSSSFVIVDADAGAKMVVL